MTATIQRNDYLAFWNKYSSDATIRSMMLNHNAEQLEESDRMDILRTLPDYDDMVVVDIGAGIGRFTTNFATKAKQVISADFIESFIQQNKIRNAHFDNIIYQTSNAIANLGLQLEPNSVDLFFSNWLLMYLEDGDVVQFLLKAMEALKPNAFLHLRESCTESSTTKKAKGSMHAGENPTHYRHASVYIRLLQKLRWRDKDGQLWGFQIYFSNSVPTYIETASNWRQVHWLSKKVRAHHGTGIENLDSLTFAMTQWKILQNHTELVLSDKQSWTDQILSESLQKIGFSDNDTILTYQPRLISPFLYINSNLLLDKTGANVWSVELNPYSYCERLSMANLIANKRARYSWSSNLNDTLTHWHTKQVQFQGFVATEFLLSTDEDVLQNLNKVLSPKAEIILIEPALSLEDFDMKCAPSIRRHFELLSITDVSETARLQQQNGECQQKQEFNSLSQSTSWLLVHARVH